MHDMQSELLTATFGRKGLHVSVSSAAPDALHA